MKRPLVLSNEAARHAFRQRLPQHAFKLKSETVRSLRTERSDDHDWKLFLLSFVAFFTVAYSFIA